MKDELNIHVYLDETDTPFSRYYSSDDVHLSSDLEEFLLSKLHSGKKKEVEILFLGENDFDEKSLQTATFNTFSSLLDEEEYTYARNVKKTVVLFVIGIIVGVIYLKLTSSHSYLAGILSIVSWVFIWSGTEIYFFDNQQIKRNIRRCKSIVNANVCKK